MRFANSYSRSFKFGEYIVDAVYFADCVWRVRIQPRDWAIISGMPDMSNGEIIEGVLTAYNNADMI